MAESLAEEEFTMGEKNSNLYEEVEIEERNDGISTREALFGVIGDEPVEISPEMAKQFDRMTRVLHNTLHGKHDYSDVPF
jgi:hypothetical protein